MKSIKDRLEFARAELGLSYAAMGKPLGLKHEAFRVAVQREKLNEGYLMLIEHHWNLRRSWIKTGQGNMYIDRSQDLNLSDDDINRVAEKVIQKMKPYFNKLDNIEGVSDLMVKLMLYMDQLVDEVETTVPSHPQKHQQS